MKFTIRSIAASLLLFTLLTGNIISHAQQTSSKSPTGKTTRQLELPDFYRFETVGSPVISPDGRFVAYVRSSIVEKDNRRQGDIWVVSTDGSVSARKISTAFTTSSSPRWSPDGKLLFFVARVPGKVVSSFEPSYYFLSMDKPDARPINIPGVAGEPIFSPDNQWIAFTKPTRSKQKTQKQNGAADGR